MYNGMLHRFIKGNAVAYGRYISKSTHNKEFSVLAGSTALKEPVKSGNVNRRKPERDQLVRDGVLVDHPTDLSLYYFPEDYTFSSPTFAGDIIQSANCSAPQYWLSILTDDRLVSK